MLLSHVSASRKPPGFPPTQPHHPGTPLCCSCLLGCRSPPLSYCEGRQDRVTAVSPAPGTVPAHRRCSRNGWNEKQTSIVQGQGPAPCGLSRSGLWMIEYHSQTMVCASAQERPQNLPLVTAGTPRRRRRGKGTPREQTQGCCRPRPPDASVLCPAHQASCATRWSTTACPRRTSVSTRPSASLWTKDSGKAWLTPPAPGPGDSPAVWV